MELGVSVKKNNLLKKYTQNEKTITGFTQKSLHSLKSKNQYYI